jgi:D-alanyl-lipoteichoic acid acyltransferase DltB (MBOAT superfamily)
VYIPLGGSKGSKTKQIRNVFIIFLLSGFWHGANWTFLAWGAINAIFFLPLLLLKKNRSNLDSVSIELSLNSIKVISQIVFTFIITCFAWIFFRSPSIGSAVNYIERIFTQGEFAKQYLKNERYNYEILILIVSFIAIEWINRNKIEPLSGKNSWIKVALCLIGIVVLGVFSDYKSFIYFQF